MDKLTYVLTTVVLLCALPLYCDMRSVKERMYYDVMDVMDVGDAGLKSKNGPSITDGQEAPVIKSLRHKRRQQEDKRIKVKPGNKRSKPRKTKTITLDSPSVLLRNNHLVTSQNVKANKKKEKYPFQNTALGRKLPSEYLDDYPEYSVTMNKGREETIPNVGESQNPLSKNTKQINKKSKEVNKGDKKLENETPRIDSEIDKRQKYKTASKKNQKLSKDTKEDKKQGDESSSKDTKADKKQGDDTMSNITKGNEKEEVGSSSKDIEADKKHGNETLSNNTKGNENKEDGSSSKDIVVDKKHGNETISNNTKGNEKEEDGSLSKDIEADKKHGNETISNKTKGNEKDEDGSSSKDIEVNKKHGNETISNTTEADKKQVHDLLNIFKSVSLQIANGHEKLEDEMPSNDIEGPKQKNEEKPLTDYEVVESTSEDNIGDKKQENELLRNDTDNVTKQGNETIINNPHLNGYYDEVNQTQEDETSTEDTEENNDRTKQFYPSVANYSDHAEFMSIQKVITTIKEKYNQRTKNTVAPKKHKEKIKLHNKQIPGVTREACNDCATEKNH